MLSLSKTAVERETGCCCQCQHAKCVRPGRIEYVYISLPINSLPVCAVERPVLDGLGNVLGLDVFDVLDVGHGA